MDERDIEEERKNRKRKVRGIGKMLIFEIVILVFLIRNPKARGQIKH
jgi:hypothetical protein